MSSIELSDECLLQTSEIGHISEIHLCGAGRDIRDGFHQFSNHRLADYFALQFKVRAGDLGVTEVYDPENDGFISVHGVVLGSSHLHGCVGARSAYHWHWPDLAREKCEAPLMTVAETVCSVNVDNIVCDRRHEVIIAALEARGFRLHEISRASQQHKQPGVYFDGVASVLRHDPRRLWRVNLALRCLPRMGGARRPWVVRVLTGHLVHIFWSARPLLSARHRLY